MKRGWDIHIFNHKMKWSPWVSYSFKAALHDFSLCTSMHFWCHGIILKKILSIEKLSLTWNKQTHCSKLGPLSRIFQIVWRQRLVWDFSIEWWESDKQWFLTIGTFPELKQHPVNIEHLLKSKLSWPVFCVTDSTQIWYRRLTTTKNGFYWIITWKLQFISGMNLWWGNKILVEVVFWGDFSWLGRCE